MMDGARPLKGFDNRGRVFDAGDFILRVPDPAYAERALSLFRRYESDGLDSLGIVGTELAAGETLAFRHRKLLISYPFEWPADMLKDAALFHLDLMSGLAKRGLALKDALPENVLFDGTRPAFIDFFSIVESFADESWLTEGAANRSPLQMVMERMFFPYFVVPLLMMAAGDYELARRMLSEKACNCGGWEPRRKDFLLMNRGLFAQVRAMFRYRALKASVAPDSVAQLRSMIETLNVTPRGSDYLDYYAAKKEDFDLDDSGTWKEKQKSFQTLLSTMRPATLLDLGANTGWFSRLAARMGTRVIATDVDEAAIDDLYLRARAGGAPILPLRLSFGELTRVVDCPEAEGMFLPATERLQADLVCCIGLLHHLVLGEGRAMGDVLEVLAALARRALVVEFIALDDELIRENPGFFASLEEHSPETYNLDALLEAGQSLFRSVTKLPSHPDTRTLVVFEK